MKRLTKIFHALIGIAALICTTVIATGRLAWRSINNFMRRRPKWQRYIIITFVVLLCVRFIASVIIDFYNQTHGRDYWDRELSDNISLHSFTDNKWRVYDKKNGKYTTKRLNWVSEVNCNDSLAVYALPDKRGYINVNNGKIVIDAEDNDYTKAWVFSEGVAAVLKEGKIGFINANNEVVIPFQFDYSDKCRMYDFGYVFHNGNCVMSNIDGDFGLIDHNGNWVVEPEYDEIWAPHKSGYRVIIKDGKHGILDSDCAVVYPVEYEYIDILNNGFVLNKEGRKWQTDFEGNVVQPFMFDNTCYLKYPIGYNESGEIQYAFADFVKYEVMNSYGIMNRITGEPVTPAIYSDINMLSKDLFEVQEYDSYDWHLIGISDNNVN